MTIKKAITFRASSIGDCLMAKYLLDNIHAAYPQARCGIVVAGRAGMIKDLFAAYPWIEVIESNRRNPLSLIRLWLGFRGSDIVVTQYAGKKGGKFSMASKIMARLLARRGGCIGFNDVSRWNKAIFDVILPVRSDQAVAWHEREVLRSVNIPVSIAVPKLDLKKDTRVLERFSLTPGEYVVVHLFAGGAGRGMNTDKKKELIMLLAQKNPGIKLVLSGGKQDREEALNISSDINATVIAGQTSLQELMSLISDSRGVVSLDTGVAHISAQLGKRLTVIRTCLAPNWWVGGQYGSNAPISVFEHDEACASGHVFKDYPACINSVDLERVASSVLQ